MPKLIPEFLGRRPKAKQGLPETGRMEPPPTVSPEGNPGRLTSKDEVQVDPEALAARAREAAAAAKDEHSQRMTEMEQRFPAFAQSDEMKSYAEFVLQRFNPEFAQDPTETVAIPILEYHVPAKSFSTDDTASPAWRALFRSMQGGDWPEGTQQIVLTPQGLREYGRTAGREKTSRPVTAQALAASGVSFSELQRAVRTTVERAIDKPNRAKTVDITTGADDRLKTRGLAPQRDVASLMAKAEECLQDPAAWKRGERLLELVRTETVGMTPAEFKDFATTLMARVRDSTWYSGYAWSGDRNLGVFSRHITEVAILLAHRARDVGFKSSDLGWYKNEVRLMKNAALTGTVSYVAREPDGRTSDDFWGGPYWASRVYEVWGALEDHAGLPSMGPSIDLVQKMGWRDLT